MVGRRELWEGVEALAALLARVAQSQSTTYDVS
jgi:hypothetical protein